jgi:hypothetical protein
MADTLFSILHQAGYDLQVYNHNGRYTVLNLTSGRLWPTGVQSQRPILSWYLYIRPAVPYRGISPMANTELSVIYSGLYGFGLHTFYIVMTLTSISYYIVDLDIGSASMCSTWTGQCQAGHDSTRFLHVRSHGSTHINDWSMWVMAAIHQYDGLWRFFLCSLPIYSFINWSAIMINIFHIINQIKLCKALLYLGQMPDGGEQHLFVIIYDKS